MKFSVISGSKARFRMRRVQITSFFSIHVIFSFFLGRQYAFAPDESNYLLTFDYLYGPKAIENPQIFSGWITAPKAFLWLSYLPARILNLVGVPNYLSIRVLSIILACLTVYLLMDILDRSSIHGKAHSKLIFSVFFIPSVFLWTSTGLRESFIMAEIAIFLAGLNHFFLKENRRAVLFLFVGSYGLLSTKSYLWAVLMLSLLFFSSLMVYQNSNRRRIWLLFAAGLIAPALIFLSTTSIYALNFIFKSSISAAGERTGDSVSKVYIDTTGTGSTGTGSTGTGSTGTGSTGTGSTGTGSTGTGSTGTGSTGTVVTFHGDFTLIAFYSYLVENPNSILSKTFRALGLTGKIQEIWDDKIALGLVSKDNQVGSDSSSLNGHILEPGTLSKPLSMIGPALIFLFGPFPFIGNPGIAVAIASFESLLWWVFYTVVIFQFIKFRKTSFLRDPQILFTLIFVAGEVFFSALVEVNLGTSFRHRSIILVPLVFLYVRLAQRAAEQKEKELEDI